MSSQGVLDQTRKTYFSPATDTLGPFLQFVGTAQTRILLADYSFNLEPLVQLLIQKHQAGVDVRLVLDKSQAGGSTESPVIEQLKAAGIPMAIGTSSMHKIMHQKFTVIDGEWVQSGSWNYTTSAAKECNFYDIEHSTDRATLFTAAWEAIWGFIAANEPSGVFNAPASLGS